MAEKEPKAGMPFLDHLEELRWRIVWSLAAVICGTLLGFYLVQRLELLALLTRPIEPYLPDGRLMVIRPTDGFLIRIKLAMVMGMILGAPIIAWQLWAFLSPALYKNEKKKIIPALFVGLLLFLAGVVMAYSIVLPAILKILYGFWVDDFIGMITASYYFSFATQIILAFGLVFQLPLFMTMLSSMGLLGPEFYARNRRYAVVAAALLGSFLTPPDPASMLMMMGPMYLLYEVGIIASKLAWKRRARSIAVIFFALATSGIGELSAQDPVLLLSRDSIKAAQRQPLVPEQLVTVTDSGVVASPTIDSTAAARLGLPSAPSRSFPSPDSIIMALLERSGFRPTRYAADSLKMVAATQQIDLTGNALLKRESGTIEADTVSFMQERCLLLARGDPVLFDGGTVLVAQGEDGMSYDTCERRGLVHEALTNFNMTGVNWFLRGGIAIDSASTRLYSSDSDLTSCDVPSPHYHFAAGKVKWVSNNIMVTRPVVLYVRDVPIMWLPFMFQDVRTGRRSGMLIPRFGINDLIRPSAGYRRSISNVGYYLALSDYYDVRLSLDWFAESFVSLNGQIRYKWLDRFVDGNLSVSRIRESGAAGSRSLRLLWNHQQSFDQRTRLSISIDFASSSRVVERNAIDPFLVTATLTSAVNFNKQFDWGTLVVGGRRTQNITDDLVTESFPTISLTPAPINLGRNVTWSPSFSMTNNRTLNQPGGLIEVPPIDGVQQFDSLFTASRNTNININTPLRIGRWNWQNSFTITDFATNKPSTQTLVDPDDSTRTLTRFFGSDFSTGIDWNTSFSLPLLFASSWKLQPSIGIRNSTSGPFLLRNRNTNGRFVSQGKRLAIGVSMAPTVFGFFPGIGPLSRIRHSFSPRFQWSYAPAATIPEAYARALDPSGSRGEIRSDPLQTLSLALSQTFEGKYRLAEEDSLTDPRNARKIKILSLQTSSVQYDFEQAKEEGRTGWRTQTISNSFTSELLPGFSIRSTHDLWDGTVGFDSTAFSPFLTQVSARFRLSGSTITRIIGLIAGKAVDVEADDALEVEDPNADDPLTGPLSTPLNRIAGMSLSRLGTRAPQGGGFSSSFTYDSRRRRPVEGEDTEDGNRTLGFSVGFSPSPFWSLSWNTQYNLTTKEFGQHVLRMDRDLHRWRATFAFVQSPNGNVAFNFFVSLIDQPEIKFQYDQRTINR